MYMCMYVYTDACVYITIFTEVSSLSGLFKVNTVFVYALSDVSTMSETK